MVTPTPPRQPGKWRLYLVLGGIAVFLVVVLWAVQNNQSASDLAIGNCFDLPSGTDVSTVTRHECTAAHDAEVFAVVEWTGGSSYPITSISRGPFIETACVPVFATYVGKGIEETKDLEIGYFFPSSSGWSGGDRTFTCYAVRADGAKLSKPLKGSGGS